MSYSHRRDALRQGAIQVFTIGAILAMLWLVASLVRQRLEAMGINTGFAFLSHRAGYDLGESLIPYDGDSSYGRALLAGFSNTLKVALSSIFVALALGLIAAGAMLSGHASANRVARFYIRTVRNTPLLLQLFFWFGVFTISLPGIRERITLLPGVYLSNRGLNFPTPDATMWAFIAVTVVTLAATTVAHRHLRNRGKNTIVLRYIGWGVGLALVPLAATLDFAAFNMPEAGRFAIKGGGVLTPEFMTLFFGLSIYTGTYIAEVLRGAVQAVAEGQSEAAGALGLTRLQSFRLVVLPQATRIALPSTVSELLNLVKNSSLGVAVGYPDLVSAGNTAMNQTGQAIEMISIYMVAYVAINVVITKFSKMLEARYEW
ncbi:ABC transporter permease subunit [Epibacterium ulvae]|uniref:amino acid ABC transporter permease n=1 Tax=Epibacterium ulvae TaxID=1156985 RepID=UPI001BFC53AA|nr:ABC transporter permease subunit [Epibacterium ulvae]MBT8153901.1 ABC transporter permease subunit [Epibacterium ulvae]